MRIKHFFTKLSQVADKPSLRIDVNYRLFIDVMNAMVWKNSDTTLGHILHKIDSEKKKKGNLEEPEILIDLSNVERRYNNLINVTSTYEIGSDKNVLEHGDIIIPKIQPRMGNIFINEEKKEFLGSSEFVEYLCDIDKIIPKFLFYLLCHPTFLETLFLCESGKTHRRVNHDELLTYKIPYVDITNQKEALVKIENIEEKIKKYKIQAIPATTIIDDFFENEFGIKKNSIQEQYQPKFSIKLNELGNSYDIRSSFRYNSHKFDFLNLPVFQEHRFSDVIEKEGTTLGRQMSPEEILESSSVYYINTNSIKIDGFDETVLTPITETFFNANSQLKVLENDILLISSGEGSIGRATLFTSEKNCITSQFVMKLRPKKGVNIRYILYYMQSFYFQYTVEKFKKGKGNMTNIFAAQVLDFPILLPNDSIQNKIVGEISRKIDEQHKFDLEVMSLREQIDKIIESYAGI